MSSPDWLAFASSLTFFFFFYSSPSSAGAFSLLLDLALLAPPSSCTSSAAAGAFFLGLTVFSSAFPSSPSLLRAFLTLGFCYLSGDSSSFSFSSTFFDSYLCLILSSRIFFFSFLLWIVEYKLLLLTFSSHSGGLKELKTHRGLQWVSHTCTKRSKDLQIISNFQFLHW